MVLIIAFFTEPAAEDLRSGRRSIPDSSGGTWNLDHSACFENAVGSAPWNAGVVAGPDYQCALRSRCAAKWAVGSEPLLVATPGLKTGRQVGPGDIAGGLPAALTIFMRHGCAHHAWKTASKMERSRFQAARNSRSFSPKRNTFVVLGPPASRPMPFTFFTEARRDGYEGRGLEFVPFSRFLK